MGDTVFFLLLPFETWSMMLMALLQRIHPSTKRLLAKAKRGFADASPGLLSETNLFVLVTETEAMISACGAVNTRRTATDNTHSHRESLSFSTRCKISVVYIRREWPVQKSLLICFSASRAAQGKETFRQTPPTRLRPLLDKALLVC